MTAKYFLFVLLLLTTNCRFAPEDPQNSLAKAQKSGLMVGLIEAPPWAGLKQGKPVGIEVELIQNFSQTLPANIHWFYGSEEELMLKLKHFELHVVLGGLTKENPWKKKVAFTRAYARQKIRGKKVDKVLALPPGENGLLYRLESFLIENDQAIFSMALSRGRGHELFEP